MLLVTLSGWGQALTGTILGSITDPSGAVLPGVEVTVTNTGTNRERVVLTSGSGGYSVPNLAVGEYQIEASIPGFNTAQVTGITLRIDDSQRHDISLEVGQVNTLVEVVAETELFQSDTSSVGTVITSPTIIGLPLNGRQFETLVQLLPGAVNSAQGSENGNRGGFNVSGFDENFTSFFLDGFDNGDPGIRSFSFRPSVDLIQEFSVLQNSYKAEYGRNGGAVINVTTKAGTNAFHGSAWEFHRNDNHNLDARNVFATEGQKPDLLRNQFGVTFGGPIAQDRAFFFVAYEGLREKRGETTRAFVPTLLMRDGDFSEVSGPIIDLQAGEPFPGNIIPANSMNAIARDVVAAYPLPNIPGAALDAPNRLEIANVINDTDDISARLDTSIFSNTQMMARYSFSNSRIVDPFRSTGAGSATELSEFGQTNNIIRTNTGIGFTTVIDANLLHEFRFGYNRYKQPQIPVQPLPSNQVPLAGVVEHFLNFQPSGFASIGSGREFQRVNNVYNYIDQLSWTRGNHQIKLGVDVRRYLFNASSAGANTFLFGGLSGNSLSDLFQGIPVRTTWFCGDPAGHTRKTEAAAYFQDDWKVTPTLTLNLGLRYEWYGRILEKHNKQSTWLPEDNSIHVAGTDIIPQLVDDDYNNFAPRIGFAWRPFSDDRTVLRGGYGIFYDSQMRHNYLSIGFPFFTTSIFSQTGDLSLTLDDPFPGQGQANILPFALQPDFNDSYGQHWNLGIQREVFRDTILDVAYVGNHFVKLRRYRNPNQPLPGMFPPIFPFGGGPFPFIVLQEQAGSSNYHALQVRAEGSPMDRLRFLSSYTWSHSIDDRWGEGDASNIFLPFPQNSHNPSLDRSSSDFDIRHRYSLSYIYEIPGVDSDGLAGHALNGWGVTGILTLQSGLPFSVGLEPGVVFGGFPSFFYGVRPNAVAGEDPVPSNQGPDNWVNSDAFTRPDGAELGDVGRNTMTGPSYKNFDFSITKDFEIGESRTLQFRTEFFNLTNHPNFGLPGQEFGASDFGVISTTVGSERQIQFGLRYDF
jgi:outer membrane receptor protein involved in Fe transport